MARHLADHQRVRLFKDRGSVGLVLKLSDQVQPGIVLLPGQRPDRETVGGTINILRSDRYTDIGERATYQSNWVDIALWDDAARLRTINSVVLVIVAVVLIVVVLVAIAFMDLPAYLARRIGCVRGSLQGYRMDVGVGGIGFEGRHKRVEVLRDDVLSRDRYDVGLCPRACHGAAIHRASLWRWDPCRGCQIGAEEHEDAAGIARLAEMDVRLRQHACVR